MSKKHKKRKHKHQHQKGHGKGSNTANVTPSTTTKTVRREPVAVAETVKHSSNVKTPLTLETTFPNQKYKVIRKPEDWTGMMEFPYVNQIGLCIGTDRNNGARLELSSGEIVDLPFNILELVEITNETEIKPTESPVIASKVVTTENVKKGAQYKVARKPGRWRTQCKFLNRVGVCILIDDRGARLRFSDNEDLSFELECLEEVEPMDLNNNSKINEDTVEIGDMFRVIKVPSNFGSDAESLVGKIGKAKWASYRGVCLKFDDGSGYVIEYDCLDRFTTKPETTNPTNMPTKLKANNMVIGRKYKFAKLPDGPNWSGVAHLLGQMAEVVWVSDVAGVRLKFKNNTEFTVPFSSVEDLPRPDEIDLLALIKKNPERVLKIIKGLNKLTKLRPVRDFIEKGKLPGDDELATPKPLVLPVDEVLPTADGSDEASQMQDRVLALIGPIQSTESNNPS